MNERIANGERRTVTEAYKVDAYAGSRDGRLSAQWAMRGPDERALSLESLHEKLFARSEHAHTDIIETRGIRIVQDDTNAAGLMIEYDTNQRGTVRNRPSHHAFGQMCSLVGAPAGYLRQLSPAIAAINLQYGLHTTRENIKTYANDGVASLMAVTGPDYGRVKDHVVVRSVMDSIPSHWKIPGKMNWSNGTYDPFAPVTLDSTTLYFSDHDVFGFMCDDTHPICIGKTKDGDDDLLFPGFMFWNGENGGTTLGAEMFYLRGVCMNRNLWGVEESTKIKIRHSKNAPTRFGSEMVPQLQHFTNLAGLGVVEKVRAAQEAIVAQDDDARVAFLAGLKFGKQNTAAILARHVTEEGKPASSVWDMVQAITAHARDIEHTDSRVDVERVAGRLMDKVAA